MMGMMVQGRIDKVRDPVIRGEKIIGSEGSQLMAEIRGGSWAEMGRRFRRLN